MPTQAVERLLARKIGLDPETVGNGLIVRALQARMTALDLNREAYLRLLDESSAEQQELIEEVVIPESWFLRDRLPFDTLRDLVTDRCLRDSAGPTLRALSVPCAGGEEPYSIAITLREAGLPFERFRIDAVDVSIRSLVRAERGTYPENSFRGTDSAIRARYFHECPDGFALDGAIRATVRFIHGNVLDPRLLSGGPPYDVIFCRNLLIYLNDESRARALENLDRLLGPSGVLVLGHADRPLGAKARFAPYGAKGAFAWRRVGDEPTRIEPNPTLRPVLRSSGVQSAARRVSIATGDAPGARGARPRPPETEPVRGLSPSLFDQAAALADQGCHAQSAALCERSLREDGPSAPTFFLLGMVRQALGDPVAAEACFLKTVYLNPAHDEALLALAFCAQRRGDPSAAAGYRRRAERALSKTEGSS